MDQREEHRDSAEHEQRLVPVYELQLRADDSPSASLRIASVVAGEAVTIRCSIEPDSVEAFIPGTLGLYKNGKRVEEEGKEEDGVKAEARMRRRKTGMGAGWSRRDIGEEEMEEEEDGRVISHTFVPWPSSAQLRFKPFGEYFVATDYGHHLGHSVHHHRSFPTHRKKQTIAARRDHPPSLLFHCSASVRPGEAQRRGRVPDANLYQRTLKMSPLGWASSRTRTDPCPPEIGLSQRGACEQPTDRPSAHLCRSDDRHCEKPHTALVGSAFLCLSLVFVAFGLGLALFREKRRRRVKTMKAVAVRLGESDGGESESRRNLVDNKDDNDNEVRTRGTNYAVAGRNEFAGPEWDSGAPRPPSTLPPSNRQSPIPALYAVPSLKGHCQSAGGGAAQRRIYSEGGGYDNLDRLREEIRRQKMRMEVEGKRREEASKGDGPPMVMGSGGTGKNTTGPAPLELLDDHSQYQKEKPQTAKL